MLRKSNPILPLTAMFAFADHGFGGSCRKVARKALAGLSVLSFLSAAIFTIGLLSTQTRNIKAQERRVERNNLERLLQGAERAKTIEQIPPQFVSAIRREYELSPEIQKETKFEPYLASRYFWTVEAGQISGILPVVPKLAAMCADGKCDGPLNPLVWAGDWTGGTGTDISDPNLPIATWTPGLVPNNNSISGTSCGSHNLQAHHSIVPNGNDPVIPSLKTVAPVPATGNVSSLLLGNRCFNYGAEKVTKTFTVAPGDTTLQFWYATVLQNPAGHSPAIQPGFGAYLVGQGSTTPMPNRIDLDPTAAGYQGFVVADSNNPFFGSTIVSGEKVVYRLWTCVTVDLTGLEGQTLTLVLANRDCGAGGHWGYSYIDSFCLGCAGNPTGDASFNPAKSDCARGQVCFDYTVPKLPNGATGQVNLSLALYQNGALVNTLTSGPLTANGTHCFTNVLSGLNPSAGGFDWKATANFTITGATISPIEIGKTGEGFVAGKNNDCVIAPPAVDPCCPPWNKDVLKDMMFYVGSGSISAPYTLKFQPTSTLLSQMQTYFTYVNSVNPAINSITIDWSLHDLGASTTGSGVPVGSTVSTTWNTTTGGNPIPNTNFFTLPTYAMQVGRWYRVQTLIKTNGPRFFPEKCDNNDMLVRVQVMNAKGVAAGGQPVLEFSDGKRVLKSIPVTESRGGPRR
jgi:hypothetical protein